ncbi:DUF2207 domain-containing protein [Deinococcus psychrotolerans]|uniref:DUF2207 domain-containing protein n=1 Tax=Deinococcus psychrotolerans TaxID=2489213 RepID=A0A3G8YFW5_9DEIO|nr:DUF2207 domain-containing protein [Deinococcus psychrotolerans]AZI44178.1 DUF2207 domain-containing protein [Deinococcus psychrotolerans]
MKLRHIWISGLTLAVLGLPTGTAQNVKKTYSAERFDSAIQVERGGSLLITETTTFNFAGGPFTFVFRELPLGKTDGLSVLSASVDGLVYPIGNQPGQVEISGSDPRRVTWHLEPLSNATRTLKLTYRASGVVRRKDGSDALIWQPLPDEYAYPIAESRTTFSFPAAATLVAAPVVQRGTATIQQAPNQVTYTAQNLQPNALLIVELPFREGSLIAGPPQWQIDQERNAERLPYWIGAAILLLIGGLAWMWTYQRRHSAVSVSVSGSVTTPPSALPPALAGALVSGGTLNWNHLQGTLYRLAERGVLVIEQQSDVDKGSKPEFAIRLLDQKAELAPHERGLIDMLFAGESSAQSALKQPSVKLSQVSQKTQGRGWKLFTVPLQSELGRAGFISEERQSERNTLIYLSIALLVLGALGMLLTAIWGGPLGYAPFTVAIAVVVLGLAGSLLGLSMKSLSDNGAHSAASWQAFRDHLKAVTRGDASLGNPAAFERLLPYAATFGLAHPWIKQAGQSGAARLPAYFKLLPSTPDNSGWALFMIMQVAVSSTGSGSSGTGGAGAGAGGGGSSGAG